ncbi:MAG: RNA pseudouridine synthase [Saprospiraceae bacterium]|nr:RNA pseudouridine synthase [Saprospiraceae bacterium]
MQVSDLIYFENADYIIAKKPSGLLSEEDATGSRNLRQELENYIRTKYPWKKQLICQLANRLDKPVGGLLFCAKKQSILKDIQYKFYMRNVKKLYFAVVEGSPEKKKATLENYLLKSSSEFRALPANAETKDAKLAKLSYTTLASHSNLSLLQIRLLTGKFHQIRFQLSQLGHPIWNDEWYGARRIMVEQRLGLYSYYLGFIEPNTGIQKHFNCAPPEIEPWILFNNEIQSALKAIES